MTIWSKETLLRRAQIVRALIQAGLEARLSTLEKHSPSIFMQAVEEMQEKITAINCTITLADAAYILHQMDWKQDSKGLWCNPFGGKYLADEALTRVLQGRIIITG